MINNRKNGASNTNEMIENSSKGNGHMNLSAKAMYQLD
jgi:hypothetical protein